MTPGSGRTFTADGTGWRLKLLTCNECKHSIDYHGQPFGSDERGNADYGCIGGSLVEPCPCTLEPSEISSWWFDWLVGK